MNAVPTDPTIPTNINATETESGRQAPVMPKCTICGTSIQTDRIAGVPVDSGLAHQSCIKLGIPSRARKL